MRCPVDHAKTLARCKMPHNVPCEVMTCTVRCDVSLPGAMIRWLLHGAKYFAMYRATYHADWWLLTSTVRCDNLLTMRNCLAWCEVLCNVPCDVPCRLVTSTVRCDNLLTMRNCLAGCKVLCKLSCKVHAMYHAEYHAEYHVMYRAKWRPARYDATDVPVPPVLHVSVQCDRRWPMHDPDIVNPSLTSPVIDSSMVAPNYTAQWQLDLTHSSSCTSLVLPQLQVYCTVMNKKSELMLMRRTTASVSFRTQVVLVYLQHISAKIHSKCASQSKIAKKSLKTPILGVQGHSRALMLVPPGKLISSACYDKQQVCVYLQPLSC